MGPDPSMSMISQILFLILLTLINAFFASAEMAFVSLNKNKMKILAQDGNKKAVRLLRLLEEPTKFLSTIQVAITLAGFLASASAATTMAEPLGALLTELSIPYGEQIAIFIVTLILAYFTLVFGELFPKRLALLNPEKIALMSVRAVLFVSTIASPFVKLLSLSVSVLMKVVGKSEDSSESEYSEEEIRSLLEVGQETGLINESGKEMINSIFKFDDRVAYEVMTARTDVYCIDIDDPLPDYLDEMLDQRYSRIPVYENDSDNIIGILYMKDFILAARKYGFDRVDIRSVLHKPYFVPETKKIDDLFTELQESKKHIAILIDEYGGVSGIVSIEDLIEEVMGNIDDEYDDDEPKIVTLDENTYLVDGMVQLEDLNDTLGLELESEDYETISGFLIDLLGEIPEENEKEDRIIEYENCVFKIENVKERRIEKIKLCIAPKAEENEADNEKWDWKERRDREKEREKDRD